MASGDEKTVGKIGQNSKEVGGGGPSSAISCLMLTSTNYTYWAMRARAVLRVHKVWDIIEEETAKADDEKTNKNNDEKNNMVVALLFQSIPEALALQVGEITEAKKLWVAIKTRHVGAERVREARLQTLMTEFDRMKMKDTETIDEFSGRVSAISSKSAALGTVLEESKLVKKFLKSLPRKKYIHMTASLEQVLDPNTISFEDIVGRLKAYEERIKEEEDSPEDQSKFMSANTDSQVSYTNQEYNSSCRGGFRGRGRGGRFSGRGRGRGRQRQGDMSQITCFRCDKNGHYAYLCPDRLLKLQEAQEHEKEKDTEDVDSLLMHEVVYLNEKKCSPSKFETNIDGEDIWYLDNGASNHMTGDKRYFATLDPTVTGKVRFGDDSHVDIIGKGTIAFIDINGRSITFH